MQDTLLTSRVPKLMCDDIVFEIVTALKQIKSEYRKFHIFLACRFDK